MSSSSNRFALAASAAGLALLLGLGPAQAIETSGEYAYLVDETTGDVLLDKQADEPMAPSSMSKLMTIFMVFERLADGRLSMDDTLPVSEKAWRMGGSKMFVEVGTRVSISDLLHGIIIQSGNDACVVVAEGLAGSEEAFAEQMTERARELGLENSTFANSTGWPHPDQKMSARDLGHLSEILIDRFPGYYEIFDDREFTYHDITQQNRNPLLGAGIGADGLKTGHTEDAGYGLTASAVQDGRRITLVVNGLASQAERASETERLLSWAFRETSAYKLFEAGEKVEDAEVWLGVQDMVPLVTKESIAVTLDRNQRRDLKVTVRFDGPVPAPVSEGAQIATLRVEAPGREAIEKPLYAGADVEQLGIFGRLVAGGRHYLLGSL